MSEIIKFENVSKTFYENTKQHNSIKESVVNIFKNNKSEKISSREFRVLNNVSFSLKKGTTTGIIGENGNGKSTILKIVSNIYLPDKGEVIVRGKVSSLLEIGVGFQQDLTGRENVYLYGSILGLNKREVMERYEEIVSFSEIEDYMDTPVKHYSSGMYMRLAFAVAIHVNPDIILIDEVLSVGDELFQKKCMSKIEELRKQQKTILFVSHDLNIVRRICDHVIYLKKDGSIVQGEPDKMVNLYLLDMYQKNNHYRKEEQVVHEYSQRWGTMEAVIEKVSFLNQANGEQSRVFVTNDDIIINLDINNKNNVNKAVVGFAVFSKGIGDPVYLADHNCYLDGQLIDLSVSRTAKIILKSIPFLSGKYLISVVLYDETCQTPFDHQHQYHEIEVINNKEQMPSIIQLDYQWEL